MVRESWIFSPSRGAHHGTAPLRRSLIALTLGSVALLGLSPDLAMAKAPKQAATVAVAAHALPSPQAAVQHFYDALLEAMKKGPTLGFNGRYQLLAPVIDQTFDFRDMTQRAVGPNWDQMSAAERSQVTTAFRKLSVSTYAHEFKAFDGEQFKMVGEPKTGKSGGVLLRTELVPKDDEPVQLNYLLHRADGGWKIYDIYLAGAVSEVARRRDEFSALLRDKGVAGMIAELDAKSTRLASETDG
jgi:phospholipid transport system substrate-binding protein